MVLQAIEALFPETPIVIEPFRYILKRTGLQPAGTPLRLAPARNQARALQHLQMLGDRGHAHLERLGQFGDRGLTGSEPRENRAPSRIGKGREGGAELVGRHSW